MIAKRAKAVPVSVGLAAFCRAQNVESPESAIRGAWSKLLQSLRLTTPPIPLKPICEALQVVVHWENASFRHRRGNASLATENDHLTIRIHRRGPSSWRHNRFLIAHELTHALLLRLLRDYSLISSLDATKADLLELERICDLGSHELLMPSTQFRASMAKRSLGPDSLRAIHDEYLVTLGAAAERIAFLTPRGALVRLRKYARSPTEATEWRVASCFPRYSRALLRPWLPQGATLKHLPEINGLDSLPGSDDVQYGKTQVLVSGRVWESDFVAFAMPNPRIPTISLPMFEQFPVPDEAPLKSHDVLLFLQEAKLTSPSKIGLSHNYRSATKQK